MRRIHIDRKAGIPSHLLQRQDGVVGHIGRSCLVEDLCLLVQADTSVESGIRRFETRATLAKFSPHFETAMTRSRG
jgi:hypothetical protein